MGWPTTYAEWITRVKTWLDVPDLDDDTFGYCLDSANERLNRDLNSQWMEKSEPYTIVDSNPIDIISEIPDYNRMRLVTVQGYEPLHALAINEYKSKITENLTGDPLFYCVSAMQLMIYPYPAVDAIVDIDYYAKIPALSSTVASNVFSKRHPDVLLYAALLEATPFITEDERLPTWAKFYNDIKDSINVTADRANKGSTPLTRTIKVM